MCVTYSPLSTYTHGMNNTMSAVNRCAWTKIILSLYFLSVYSCPTNTNVFTTTGSIASIQYDANSLPVSNTGVTYQVIYSKGSLKVQFVMKNGQIISPVQTLGVTFTCNASTGDLSFRIDNVQTPDTVYSCPTNNNVFTTTGSSASIHYDANSLPVSNTDVTYQVIDSGVSTIVMFVMNNGQIISPVQTLGVTFTGSASTGDLSFRIDNVQIQDTGVYKLVKNTDTGTPLLCNTVYITGSISLPILTSNKSPSVGESVTLRCSGSSTTVPAGLPLVYTWQVNGTTNPADSRYTYSTSHDTLTVSDVQKSDVDRVFTCMTQEDGSRITSSSSSQLSMNILYGPDNVRLEPSPSSFNRTENTTLVPSTCRAACNPSCTMYTWTHLNSTWSTSTAVLDLGQVFRNKAGVYRCTVTRSVGYTSSIDLTIIVLFPPSSAILTGNSSTLANGSNNVTLTCTSSTANPRATISWSRNGSPIDNTNPVQETAGNYGGEMTSQVLELTPTRDDDGDVYRCTASNTVNSQSPVMSQQKVLDLKYIPEIAINNIPSDVSECTDRLTLTCTVSSKPVSTITWYRGQQLLSTTASNNVGQYTITNINRTMSGQYRCVANNGYGGNVQKTVNLTVKYTPDVSVTTRNVTTQDQSVDIVCNPSGVPGKYTFSPWTHQWDINGPVLTYPGLGNSPVLRLTNLTYEHSGVHTCTVNNGVDCSRNPDAGSGHANLKVKATQVLIDPQPSINDKRIRVASKINSPAVFNFTFWSNTDNIAVRCYRIIDGTRQNPPVGNTVFTQTTVMLPVFSSSIATSGTLASLSLEIQDVDDFGSYDIVLSNLIGTGKLLAINVVAQGPPETPVLVSVSVLSPTEVSVKWTHGFHGGLDQTIVIQISSDMIHWHNKTEVVDGMRNEPETSSTRLQGLSPSSLYYIRLLAYNDEGISENFTEVLRFNTYSDTRNQERSHINYPAVAGSTVGIVITLIMVGIGILLYRKFQCTCEMKIGRRKTVDDMVMTDNRNVYEGMNRTAGLNHVYAELNPPVSGRGSVTDDGTNVYERTATTSNTEHIYTDLQQTGKDQVQNLYVNIPCMT